jgi:hypothetical protein
LIAAVAAIVLWRKVAYGQFLGDDFILLEKVAGFNFSWSGLLSLGFFQIHHNTLLLATGFRPVPLALWLILYKVFGLEPRYYHLTILALHIINSILLYFLIRKFVERSIALIGACIFSVFCGHMEAVQWLSGFFDITCALFYLSSLIFFLRFLAKKTYRLYLISLLLAVLAILSKENAVTLPFIILMFFWLHRRGNRMDYRQSAALKLTAPYFLSFAAYLVLRRLFLWNYRTVEQGLLSFFHPKALLNVWVLLGNMVFPHQRNPFIERFLPFIVIAFLVLFFFFWKKNKTARGPLSLGVVWTLVTALPTLNFLSSSFYLQRFNYLPAAGFCLILGQMLVVIARMQERRRLTIALPCLAIILYSTNTIFENRNYWAPAWAVSAAVQKSFEDDVSPALPSPAKVYFLKVPELVKTIDVFFTGLPQAFRLLATRRDAEYYLVSKVTPEVPPLVENADKLTVENKKTNYFFFDWNDSEKRFQKKREAFDDFVLPEPDKIPAWDFSKYQDFSEWEMYDLQILLDRKTGSYSFRTTGPDSFLKSPFIGGRKIKYVQVVYSADDDDHARLMGQVFWVTANDLQYDGRKSIKFPIRNGGKRYTYTVPLYLNSSSVDEPIQRLAFRLSDHSDTVLGIKTIRIYLY